MSAINIEAFLFYFVIVDGFAVIGVYPISWVSQFFVVGGCLVFSFFIIR